MCLLSTHENIELLPPLGEVDLILDEVRVADLDEGEILEDEADIGDTRRAGLCQGEPEHKHTLTINNLLCSPSPYKDKHHLTNMKKIFPF